MAGEAASPVPPEAKFSLRACCYDAPAGVGFVEIAGERGPLPRGNPPLLVEDYGRPAYETDRATAWHESGHALAAIVAGGKVAKVTLREPNPKAACRDIPFGAHTVFALAGPVAENLARGWIKPIARDVVDDHLAIVAAPAGGSCDMCLALRPCAKRAGLDNRTEALRLFRLAERATVALIDHAHARRFLRSAAYELLREGELVGERVHWIADAVIDPETLETLKKIITLEN